jgi:hypothetical protein
VTLRNCRFAYDPDSDFSVLFVNRSFVTVELIVDQVRSRASLIAQKDHSVEASEVDEGAGCGEFGRPLICFSRTFELALFRDVTTQRTDTLSALAEFERSRCVERVKVGLDRARRQGKRLGRPRKTAALVIVPGGSVRSAAAAWGVSKSTAARWIAAGRLPACTV